MANELLGKARKSKNDEFYTQYADIEKEMNAYVDYNADVFRGKRILLPCDDPEWSNFTKYFAQNFDNFGLKKLISTSYAPNSKPQELSYQPTLFELESADFDSEKTQANGKIFTLTNDKTGDGVIDVEDLEWAYLEGNGDFRSDEIKALRDEADIVITNPPFSLFKEFLAWIREANKDFVIVGNQNAITYKEVFPLFKENKIWLGKGFTRNMAHFYTPYVPESKWIEQEGDHIVRVAGIQWFTNLEHGRRHEPLPLMTEADNIKYSKHKEVREVGYKTYDNYDAIEVPFSDAIPSDYEGVMGVPITFLTKYSPEQFEILGGDAFDGTPPTKKYANKVKVVNGVRMKSTTGTMGCVIRREDFGSGTCFDVGYPVQAVYKRIFIRHRKADR
jgi:Ca2+-binding EF-hand superfamily protein